SSSWTTAATGRSGRTSTPSTACTSTSCSVATPRLRSPEARANTRRHLMATTTQIDYDVVIAGAGPTGLTLANHLGTLGVRTLVLEKLPALIDYPRGVGIDDDALRSFQAVGLVDAVRRHTVPNQIMRFVDKRGRLLAAIAPTAQPFGW